MTGRTLREALSATCVCGVTFGVIADEFFAGLPPEERDALGRALRDSPLQDADDVLFTAACPDGSVLCPGCGGLFAAYSSLVRQRS